MKCLIAGSGWSIPSETRHNTSLFLQNGAAGLLVDCNGIAAARLDAFGFPFETLEHIFLTHEHTDHIGAIGNLVTQIWLKSCHYRPESRRIDPLNIYANARTLARMQAIFAAIGLEASAHLFPLRLHELPESGGWIDIAGFALEYIPVKHGGTPCFGLAMRGDRRGLVYSADTEPLPALYARLQPGDALVHECNDLDLPRQPGHTTWPQLRAALAGVPSVETYLVHLPPLEKPGEFWEVDGAATVVPATDGMVIDF